VWSPVQSSSKRRLPTGFSFGAASSARDPNPEDEKEENQVVPEHVHGKNESGGYREKGA